MAVLITSTSAEAVEEALIRRIAAIEPTAQKYRSHRWTPEEDNRERATSLQVRAFTLELAPVGDVEEGLTGLADCETEVIVTVRVDYRQVPPEYLGTIVVHDSQDLADTLEDSWHPVITGLTRTEYLGDEPEGDEERQRIAYTFAVSYQRPRRAT